MTGIDMTIVGAALAVAWWELDRRAKRREAIRNAPRCDLCEEERIHGQGEAFGTYHEFHAYSTNKRRWVMRMPGSLLDG